MNKEELIKLAREAGFCTLLPSEHIDGTGGIYVGDDDITDSLNRFTALVAAAERKRLEATAWGASKKWIVEAVAAEREACAKVCDALHYEVDAYGAQCAAAIRARGQK